MGVRPSEEIEESIDGLFVTCLPLIRAPDAGKIYSPGSLSMQTPRHSSHPSGVPIQLPPNLLEKQELQIGNFHSLVTI